MRIIIVGEFYEESFAQHILENFQHLNHETKSFSMVPNTSFISILNNANFIRATLKRATFEGIDKENILNSSIESLIVNIDSMNDIQTKKNLITITSPTPENGKSFIAKNLVEGYVKLGKKVLLIDGDHKRGVQGKNFDKKSIDKEVFFSIDATNIENFVVKENFYLIPRLKNLYNSFEFLYNNKFQQKIDFLKDYFDYIIIDTAPILSVTDTSILVEKSDFNILITRHAINKINQIKQAVQHFEQIGKNIDGIIYNGYKKPNSYYGYYGLYGNYAYQYYAEKYLDGSYDYKK